MTVPKEADCVYEVAELEPAMFPTVPLTVAAVALRLRNVPTVTLNRYIDPSNPR